MTIHFEGVGMRYGSQVALDNLTLTLGARELTVLVGPSGSGKSTLLRTINHLVVPVAGAVLLDGRRVDSWKPEELRRSIGYGIQSVGLFPHYTVGKNVAVVPSLLKWPRARIAARVEELLVLVGLDPARYRDRYPHELSGGEAQRVGVARALAADPPILLLDEPFSAVDPITRLRLQGEFLSIQKALHKTVVFVTHDVDEAIRMADKIVLLDHGRAVQHDSPEMLLEQPATAFAARFLGSDRALKRLSRLAVADYLRPAPRATLDQSVLGHFQDANGRFVWLTDPNGRLLGSLDLELPGALSTPVDLLSPAGDDLILHRESSLKEALSVMVGSGARSLPVVNAEGKLEGEIRLSDIEGAGQTRSSAPVEVL
jgi:osmoprotectant transport system ATP-binding protein